MSTEIDDSNVEMELPAPAESFHIDTDEKANWLVKKIVSTHVIEERAQRWCELEIRRARREREFFLRRFGVELEQWLQHKLKAENGRRKSIALPAGTVGYRTEPARLQISDEAKLLNWCRRALPDAVKVSETVLRGAIADYMRATGECPDGAELAGGGQRFFVKQEHTMQKASDGMVSAADLMQAIEEIKRGDGQNIMARLFKTEPQLGIYIEGIAGHLTTQQKRPKDSIDALVDAMERILVVVRAMEISHFRMWRDSIPPMSPLARLMDPGPQNEPKK